MPSVTWLLPLTVRSTAVLVVALVLVALLRRFPAVARHRVLTLTATSLLLLPALPGLLPRWEMPLPVPPSLAPATPFVAAVPESAALEARGDRVPPVALPRVPAAPPGLPIDAIARSMGPAVSWVWLLGIAASLGGLFRSLRRESRLVSSSLPLEGPWSETLAEVRGSLGLVREVRLLACEGLEAPVTGGWRRPVVLLPPEAAAWPEEKRRVVLQHELVHVLRGDALRHLAWRLVVVLYWFHPLARLAERKASLAGEHACDETVLDLGTRPSVYARHLLEIAESLGAHTPDLAGALPMVDPGQLERRLSMILDPVRATSRSRWLTVACLVLVAGTVAAAAVVKPAPAAAAKPAAHPKATVFAEPGTACASGMGHSFNGTYSEEDREGGTFALQQGLGDGQRLCARVHGPVRFDEKSGSILELPAGSSVAVETRGRSRTRRVLVTPDAGGPRYQWWFDGASISADDAARAWIADALEVVASYRAIGSLQGQVGSLQGQIGSIQGEVGSLQGEIGSVQGRIGGLQGNVGSIQGEQGGLQGEIGGHEGAIGGLEANRSQATAAQKERIDAQIATHRAEIRKLQAELSSGQLAQRLAAAEAELRAAEEKGEREIAALEQKIEDVRADARIRDLERKIADLHADERIADIERRAKPALDRLKASL